MPEATRNTSADMREKVQTKLGKTQKKRKYIMLDLEDALSELLVVATCHHLSGMK